jgi:hypothetical protein
MNPRNRSLFFSFFITALIAGVFIYIYGVNDQIRPMSSPIFPPNTVISITWKYNNVVFVFKRTPESSLWAPDIEQSRVNKKISLLSNLSVKPIVPADFDLEGGLTVTLQFQDGNHWTGVFSQDYFIWTTGLLENSGSELSESGIEMFNEGRFAFEPLRWDWCSDSLRKITYELNEEAIELQKTSDEWEVTNLNGDAKIVESNWVNSWIEKSCQVEVQAWIDLELEAFGLDEGSFEIVRSDGASLIYSARSPQLQISEEKAIISPLLFQNLEELVQAP